MIFSIKLTGLRKLRTHLGTCAPWWPMRDAVALAYDVPKPADSLLPTIPRAAPHTSDVGWNSPHKQHGWHVSFVFITWTLYGKQALKYETFLNPRMLPYLIFVAYSNEKLTFFKCCRLHTTEDQNIYIEYLPFYYSISMKKLKNQTSLKFYFCLIQCLSLYSETHTILFIL